MLTFHSQAPYSFDPLDHDAFVHHLTQRPVLGTLVSQYRAGEIMGVLAKSWKISNDRLVWTFTLRKGLKFEDGLAITPKDVKRSLTRMAYFMNKRKSKSGLFELLLGYKDVTAPTSNFLGIEASDTEIIFRHSIAPDKFLEKLSFGLYAVVSEKDYDAASGEWKDAKKVTASGQYKLQNWDSQNKKMSLTLRSEFLPEIFPNKKFGAATFDWSSNDKNFDVYLEDSSSNKQNQGLKFEGNTKNGILYLRVHSWNLGSSPLHKVEVRRALRSRFYQHLSESKFKVTKSFIPLEVTGVTEGIAEPVANVRAKGNLKIFDSRSLGGWRKVVCEALFSAAKDIGLEPEFVTIDVKNLMKELDPNLSSYRFDVRASGTGILVEQPLDDLKFMVESTEGIRLGDPTGILKSITSKPTFEPQELNKAIWDDAISIPITHVFMGMWINPKRVDVSLLDLSQPPTELALIQPVD